MTTPPKVNVLTVDDAGNPGKLPLAELLPTPVEGVPLEAEPVRYAREKIYFLKSGPTQTIDLDDHTQYFSLIKRDTPCAVTFTTEAPEYEAASAQVRMVVEGTVTFPQVNFWIGGIEPSKGHGILTITRRRIVVGGVAYLSWEAGWAAYTAAAPLVAI